MRPRRSRLGMRLLRWAVLLAIWGLLATAGLVLWFSSDLPRPEDALDAVRRPSLTLQDRSGQVAATFGDVVGEPLHLRDLPRALPEAVVATEDRRFWHHPGIDLLGMARAAWVNARAGHVVQGGSTITQQLAKTLFLTNARTLRRKVQELLLTLWLEHRFSKREILEIYLNRVYLGAGAWGVDAAARQYFGISARRLNVWQSAVLAGLPRAPSRYNPRVNPAAAAARARDVLALMARAGVLSEAAARQEAPDPTRIAPWPTSRYARHRQDDRPLAAAADADRRRAGRGLPAGPRVRRRLGVHQALLRPPGGRAPGRLDGRGRHDHRLPARRPRRRRSRSPRPSRRWTTAPPSWTWSSTSARCWARTGATSPTTSGPSSRRPTGAGRS